MFSICEGRQRKKAKEKLETEDVAEGLFCVEEATHEKTRVAANTLSVSD